MKNLGFTYLTRKKGYYVDRHVKPATVEYRWAFMQQYLKNKLFMHRWAQISLTKAEELEATQKYSKGLGYQYTDDNN